MPELDRALEMLGTSKPRRSRSCIRDIGRVVSDLVRARALVDLMRNGGPRFRGESERGEEIDHEWYPAAARATINEIL